MQMVWSMSSTSRCIRSMSKGRVWATHEGIKEDKLELSGRNIAETIQVYYRPYNEGMCHIPSSINAVIS